MNPGSAVYVASLEGVEFGVIDDIVDDDTFRLRFKDNVWTAPWWNVFTNEEEASRRHLELKSKSPSPVGEPQREEFMEPIEYRCDGIVTIRKCPEFESAIGNKPAYWYLKRPLYTMDAKGIGWSITEIRLHKAAGYEIAYWNGERWAISKPKQFETPEEAYKEWHSRIRKVMA